MTTATCAIATLAYSLERAGGKARARAFVADLAALLSVAGGDARDVLVAVRLPVPDLEYAQGRPRQSP